MPHFISAYNLQQRDALTRQRVIELAEIGPAYWKAQGDELFQPEVTHGHFADGFKRLKDMSMNRWGGFANVYEKINAALETMKDKPVKTWEKEWTDVQAQLKEWFDPLRNQGDELPEDSYLNPDDYPPDLSEDFIEMPKMSPKEALIDNIQIFWAQNLKWCIAETSPAYLSGKTAHGLFAWKQPEVFSQQPEKRFDIEFILNKMNLPQLLYLLKRPEQAKLDENIWTYMLYGASPILDLIFERIFTDWLAFDVDNLPLENSIDSVAVGESTEDLPELYCTRNFATQNDGEAPRKQVERTLADPLNVKARKAITAWQEAGYSDKDIAAKLKKNGGSTAVIGALFSPETASKEGARNAGQRLLGDKK